MTDPINQKIPQEDLVAVNEKRLRALVKASSDVIYILSADWTVMHELDGRGFLKDAHEPITGWREINVYADDLPMVNAAIDKAISEKTIFSLEHRVNRADGTPGWTNSRAVPILDDQGNITEWVGTATDITDRKIAEEKLEASNKDLFSTNNDLQLAHSSLQAALLQAQNSELRFRYLVESAPIAMLVFKGPEMVVDLANAAILDILRKDKTIIGKPLLEAMPELQGQAAVDLLFNVYKTGQPAYGNETPVVMRRNGKNETCYFNFAYHPFIENGQITGVMDVAHEVTDQVKARQELESTLTEKINLAKTLRESEQRLQSILDTMAEGVGIIDASGQLVYANPMAQRILGLEESNIKQRTYHDAKWQNLRIDGSPLPKEDHPMSIMMRTGLSVYDQEISVQPPDGERFYISINAAPIVDEHGNITGGIGTFMDVTNRRKLMMQKDDFISVASHELKTPVTSLKASLQLLARMKDITTPPEMSSKLIQQANKSLDKLNSLIAELLNTNRISQGQLQLHKTVFRIADMVSDCCNHIRTAGTHEIILQGDLDLQIYADMQQIDQVLVNFVNNAVKYASESRKIIIEVKRVAKEIRVAVTDFGPGIPPDKKDYLFDRYYRADYSGMQFSGLGLGLYICSEIIKKHNGQIGVDSEPGQGSTFWFTLPA